MNLIQHNIQLCYEAWVYMHFIQFFLQVFIHGKSITVEPLIYEHNLISMLEFSKSRDTHDHTLLERMHKLDGN